MSFLFLCEAVQSCPLFLKQRLLDPVGRDGDGYYWLTGRVDDVINVRCVVIEIPCSCLLTWRCDYCSQLGTIYNGR
jgi:hypothetical protein